jgi:hypothetical protein
LFGQRKQGTITIGAGVPDVTGTGIMDLTDAQVAVTGTFRLIDSGGTWFVAGYGQHFPIGRANNLAGQSIAQDSTVWVNIGMKQVQFRSVCDIARTDAPYDVWFTYNK